LGPFLPRARTRQHRDGTGAGADPGRRVLDHLAIEHHDRPLVRRVPATGIRVQFLLRAIDLLGDPGGAARHGFAAPPARRAAAQRTTGNPADAIAVARDAHAVATPLPVQHVERDLGVGVGRAHSRAQDDRAPERPAAADAGGTPRGAGAFVARTGIGA